MLIDQRYAVISSLDAEEQEIGYFLNGVYYELPKDVPAGHKEGNRFIYDGKDRGYFEAATLIRDDGLVFWLRQRG